MKINEIVDKITNKTSLTKQEISFVVKNAVEGKFTENEISNFLMAIYKNGFSKSNTITLTQEMANSGKCFDLKSKFDICVDKHSTGGISDSTTLIIAPILACAKIPFAKMSGRGLGWTGGTIDKLETFNGYKSELSFENFIKNVEQSGACIISQSNDIAVADKIFYELRNKIGAVDSLPLIASSIMSKKVAIGAKTLLLDIKVGEGAFMKNLHNAKKLAKLMIEIGNRNKIKTVAFITNMNAPLGNGIGCYFEIKDVIDVLNGQTNFLSELSFALAKELLILSGKFEEKSAIKFIKKIIKNGTAFEKFNQIIEKSGGTFEIENNYEFLEIKSEKVGYISKINSKELGEIVCELGGGRKNKGEQIDHNVGIELAKNIGDYVYENEVLCKVYFKKEHLINQVFEKVKSAFIVSKKKPKTHKIILDKVR